MSVNYVTIDRFSFTLYAAHLSNTTNLPTYLDDDGKKGRGKAFYMADKLG